MNFRKEPSDQENEMMELNKNQNAHSKKVALSKKCFDCGKNCREDKKDYYMVIKYLWLKYGEGNAELCLDCLQSRVGRNLRKSDFTNCNVNKRNYFVLQL